MFHQTTLKIALAALIATTPAPGLLDAAFAGSSSRSETRHNLADDESVEVTSSRSKSRRATRSTGASDETVVTQNRGKRSRRNPGAEETEAPMIAKVEAVETDLVALAETRQDEIAKHIRLGEFEGPTGALALYQLTGKASAEMPLTPVEIKALTNLTEESDLPTIIDGAEARLIEIAGGADLLDAISEALGIPRPVAGQERQSDLGANLVLEVEDSRG